MRMPSALRLALPLVATAAFLVGCPPETGGVAQGKVSGKVVKGVVAGAAVKVFSVSGEGRRDKVVGEATTDEAGAFTASVSDHTGPAIVCATGGTYTEEATGGLVQMATNELCAVVDNHELGKETSGVLLTPFSTWHTALTGCFASSGRDTNFAAASSHAALRFNDFLSAGQVGYDFRTTEPFDVTAGVAPSLTPDVWQGILLAGVSESAKGYAVASGLDPGVRVTAATLTTALTQDIDDGACVFDGQSTTGVLSQGTVALSADSLRGAPQGLGSSILRFLENADRNLSGVTSDDVTDLVVRINEHESEIFAEGGGGGDVAAPVIAFTDMTEGQSISGLFHVAVTATDDSEITEFVFTSPTRIASTAKVCSAPEVCDLAADLNTSLEPAGDLIVAVRATDIAGNSTTQQVRLVINDSVPNIVVTSPTPQQRLVGVTAIAATASDPDGVRSLVLVAPDNIENTSLRTDTFEGTWDTRTVPEGDFVLTFLATDERDETAPLDVPVFIDNLEDGVLSGVVDVGLPVQGATVKLLDFSGAQRGDEVAEPVVTDDSGAFTLNVPSVSGPMLIVATGGQFTDPASGIDIALRNGQELTSAVDDFGPGQVLTQNVNALTTLAAARAAAVPGDVIATTIDFNTRRFGLHARRDRAEVNPLPIASIASADLTSQVIESTADRAVLGLVHVGLSRLALEAADAANLSAGDITALDVLGALVADIGDASGLFDGLDANGDAVTFDPAGQQETSAYTIRVDLAGAVNNFLVAAPLEHAATVFNRNASGIVPDLLSTNGAFFQDIAENNDPALFPADAPPIPFDRTPPSIAVSFESHPEAVFGDVLQGRLVIIRATAEDLQSGLNRFEVLAPSSLQRDSDTTTEGLRLTLTPDDAPVAIEERDDGFANDVDAACPFAPAADRLFTPSNSTCVCLQAVDGVEQVTQRIVCFERPAPSVAFNVPAPDASLGRADFSPQLNANVEIFGGYSVGGICNGAIDSTALNATIDPADSAHCTLTKSFALGSLSDGAHTVSVSFNRGGEPNLFTSDFTVDTVGAGVQLTSPTGVVGSTTYTVAGNATDAISSMTVVVRATNNGAQLASGTFTTPSFSFPVSETVGAFGPRAIEVTTVDGAGNQNTVSFAYTYDNERPGIPSLTGSAFKREDGDIPFFYPLVGFCPPAPALCVNDIVPVPNPSATQVQAAGDIFKTPGFGTPSSIVRWESRLNDSGTAPALVASFTDNGSGVSRIEWGVGTTCPTSFPHALPVTGGAATIKLTQANLSELALSLQNGSTTLCLAVRAVDKAVPANAGNSATINFRWQTIAPPINFNAVTSTPLNDPLDAASKGGDQLTTFLNSGGAVRGLHAFAKNPHNIPVRISLNAPSPVMVVKGTNEQRFDGTRASVWPLTPTVSLQSPNSSVSETQIASANPSWAANANDGITFARVWDVLNACTANACNRAVINTLNPPNNDPSSAAFNDTTTTSKEDREPLTPSTLTCFVVNQAQGTVTTNPCASVGPAGTTVFEVAAGQTVLISWMMNVEAIGEFRAPGWATTINDDVPLFNDRQPFFPNGGVVDTEAPTLSTNVTLWHKSRGFLLTHTMLWAQGTNTSFTTCTSSGNGANCHWGKAYTTLSQLELEPNFVSPLKLVTRTAIGTQATWNQNAISTPTVSRVVTP